MKKTSSNISMAGYYNHIDYIANADAIADSGFDGIMLKWGKSNAYTEKLASHCTNLGLRITNMHCSFDDVNTLWTSDCTIDKQLCNEVLASHNCGIDTVILHLSSSPTPPPPSQLGIDRLKAIMDVATKYNVKVAIENLRRCQFNRYVLDSIDSPLLGLCYDCGHANVYTKHFDVLEYLDAPIFTSHLHDNDGHADQHLLPYEGTIDWDKQMQYNLKYGITDINIEGKLRCDMPAQEYLQKAYNSALKLKQLIKGEIE